MKTDAATLNEVLKWKVKVDEVISEKVGHTFTYLEGDYPAFCGTQECNLGNVLADAMIFNELAIWTPSDVRPSGWSPYPIAMTTAGSIMAAVEPGELRRRHYNRVVQLETTACQIC